MRLRVVAGFFLCLCEVSAQSDRGTITGTVADPAGAVVANAAVEARNTDTNARYPVASSDTGNYTLAELPAGTYEVDVTAPGFKRFIRPGLIVQAAQTIRVDATLEVGSATESVTVTEAAPLLKTESGELSQTVATRTMDALPLLQLGSDQSGIRNPYSTVALLPGAFWQNLTTSVATGLSVHINGAPTGTETMLVDGMDATNLITQFAQEQNAPSMDAVQEWTVQTSNYSAEFGQTGSAVMNVTMKSGANQFHGSAYDYLQNEDLNAGVPFTNAGNGNLLRPPQRRNDYGLTLGGPVWIPKVYNGHNKTFFFFGWEQFLQHQTVLPGVLSVPTPAYRNGDFSAAIVAAGNKNLGTDPLGRPIIANTIYDPSTTRAAPNGQIVSNPFPNNTIPIARMDPVSLKMQNLIPQPFCVGGGLCNAAGAINNFQNTEAQNRTTEIPSLKLDQIIGPNDKLSFFWSRTDTDCITCYGDDGLPQPVSDTFGAAIYSHRERLNYDHTITPSLLLHLGAGFDADDLGRPSVTPDFNACANLGLCSAAFQSPSTFPQVTGLFNSQGGGFGSATAPLGPPGRVDGLYTEFNSIASLTWVKSNHTFKFGGNLANQGFYNRTLSNLQGTFGFSSGQTAMPYLVNTSTGHSLANIGPNNIGFPYSSFLLGAVDTANVDPPSDVRFGKYELGFYAQDSWKVTPRFTLDLGLRYDYSPYYQEQYGRAPDFAPNLSDPTAGGHPGSVIYQATCHCAFAKNYPWGFGPRVGIAYQVAPKTVLRGGFGVVYSPTAVATAENGGAGSASANNPFGPSSVPGMPIMSWGQGVTLNGAPLTRSQIAWPNFSPGFYPIGGIIPGTGPQYYDQNAGRPARQYQWSFSVQREVAPNLVVEASYIANRGMWWPTYLGAGVPLVNYNYLSTSLLNQYGLSLNNPADLATLLAPIGSAAAGRFQNQVPFAGFPLSASVAQSLRPFPQYNTQCNPGTPISGPCPIDAPLGDTWYNSLQMTATKRVSHGLEFTAGFTWSKSEDTFEGTPDVQNRALAKSISQYDQPLMFRTGYSYTLPKWGPKAVSYALRDWTLDGFLLYASGLPLSPPVANATGYPSALATGTINNLTFQELGPQIQTGQPLYLQNPNCHCFNPNTTFVLNPAAWANPAPGQFGGASYYGDFRAQRRPVENMGIGRTFHFRERASLSVRAEFTNIFNRTEVNNPGITGSGISPQTAPVCQLPSGKNGSCSPGQTIISGFGAINTSTVFNYPRQGQLVAQFQF
jgi:hypothetical protein